MTLLQAPAEPKPAVRTTEFWGKVVVQLVLVLNAVLQAYGKPHIDLDPTVALSIVAGAEGLHQTWRGHLKAVAAKHPVISNTTVQNTTKP